MKIYSPLRNRGIALLEFLLSLFLFGLIIAVIYPAFSIVIKTWEKIDYGNTVTDKFAVERFIRRSIEQTLPVFELERSTRSRLQTFRGGTKKIEFLTTLPAQAGIAGVYRVSIKFNEVGDHWHLTFTYQLYRRADRELETIGQDKLLVADIEDPEFQYYDNRKKQWESRWERDNRLPGNVRIRFVDLESKKTAWVIPIRSAYLLAEETRQ